MEDEYPPGGAVSVYLISRLTVALTDEADRQDNIFRLTRLWEVWAEAR